VGNATMLDAGHVQVATAFLGHVTSPSDPAILVDVSCCQLLLPVGLGHVTFGSCPFDGNGISHIRLAPFGYGVRPAELGCRLPATGPK
jgi:hypothetical protein